MTTDKCGNALLGTLVIVLAAGPMLAAEPTTKPAPGRIKLTISRKTTHILGPVNKDGTVNYIAYLNAKHSKGVTKQNNAAIPLIHILGTRILDEDSRPKICKILKIEPPTKGRDTFISWFSYARKALRDKDAKGWDTKHEELLMSEPAIWSDKQYPVTAGWIKANANALNATRDAVRRPRYYMPMISANSQERLVMMVIPGLQSYVRLGQALVARAMLKLSSGDENGAWSDLTAARRLARLIGSGPTLIEWLVANAIEDRACRACQAMAGCGKLSSAGARKFLAEMRNLGRLPDIVNTLDDCERLFMLDCIMLMAGATAREGVQGLRKSMGSTTSLGHTIPKEPTWRTNLKSLEWDEILLPMNRWYDSLIAAASKGTFRARQEALADHDRRMQKFAARATRYESFLPFVLMRLNDPNINTKKLLPVRRTISRALGNILISTLMPAMSRAVVLRDRTKSEGDMAIVAMALAAYRAEKKAYPDKLSQLTPGYLRQIHNDIFSDKPLGYEKTKKGYLLYSVGENMKYDGPKKSEDDKNDDIIVRVE